MTTTPITPAVFVAAAVASMDDAYVTPARDITVVPTGRLAAMLDAAEAMWRVAITLEGPEAYSYDHGSLYSTADEALTRVLARAFGFENGRAVHDEMADNFEGWAYNRQVVAEQVAYRASVCTECGWADSEHDADCPASPRSRPASAPPAPRPGLPECARIPAHSKEN